MCHEGDDNKNIKKQKVNMQNTEPGRSPSLSEEGPLVFAQNPSNISLLDLAHSTGLTFSPT